MTMDENTRAKYEEKIKTLLAMAKKKKNVLEYQEISDHFADLHLEEEQMDEILDALEKSGIDVLRITDDDDSRLWRKSVRENTGSLSLRMS